MPERTLYNDYTSKHLKMVLGILKDRERCTAPVEDESLRQYNNKSLVKQLIEEVKSIHFRKSNRILALRKTGTLFAPL